MSDRDDKILDRLDDIAQKQSEQHQESMKGLNKLDKKVDLHIQKTDYRLESINNLDQEQNDILEDHVRGVEALEKIHETHVAEANARFETLEAPRNWLKKTWSVIKWAGAAGGVAYIGLLIYEKLRSLNIL